MNTQAWKLMGLVVMLGALAMLEAGCPSAPTTGRWNVNVTTDASLGSGGTIPPVEVDLVAPSETDVPRWMAYKPETYFSGADSLRAGARDYAKTMTFRTGKPDTQTLAKGESPWDAWVKKQSHTMIVLVSSSGLASDAQRKLAVPITTDKIKGDTINLVVKSSGVEVESGLK